MPLIQYSESMRLSNKSLDIIETANKIINEYQAQGFDLTLRQLYYQFVARGYIPNKQTEYKRLGDIINNGRLVGLIDWSSIVDRTRNLRRLSVWDTPHQIMRAVAGQFRTDKWLDQPCRIETWIEKDALVGVIEGICNQWEIPHFSCRGYVSQSEMWSASQRIWRAFEANEQRTVLIHLGDHDPSGIDMTRDIADRLKLFIGKENDYPEDIITVERIALNMEQVREYDPPPNPAKLTDSRCDGYIKLYGGESWELDALDPRTLSSLIEDKIMDYLDQDLWDKSVSEEKKDKKILQNISRRFDEVKDFLNG